MPGSLKCPPTTLSRAHSGISMLCSSPSSTQRETHTTPSSSKVRIHQTTRLRILFYIDEAQAFCLIKTTTCIVMGDSVANENLEKDCHYTSDLQNLQKFFNPLKNFQLFTTTCQIIHCMYPSIFSVTCVYNMYFTHCRPHVLLPVSNGVSGESEENPRERRLWLHWLPVRLEV